MGGGEIRTLIDITALHQEYLALETARIPTRASDERKLELWRELRAIRENDPLHVIQWQIETFGTHIVCHETVARLVERNRHDALASILEHDVYLDLAKILQELKIAAISADNAAMRVLLDYPALRVNYLDDQDRTPLYVMRNSPLLGALLSRSDLFIEADDMINCTYSGTSADAFCMLLSCFRCDASFYDVLMYNILTNNKRDFKNDEFVSKLLAIVKFVFDINTHIVGGTSLILYVLRARVYSDKCFALFRTLLTHPNIDLSKKDAFGVNVWQLTNTKNDAYLHLLWRYYLIDKNLAGPERAVFVAQIVADERCNILDLTTLATFLNVPHNIQYSWMKLTLQQMREEMHCVGSMWDETLYEAERARRPQKKVKMMEMYRKLVDTVQTQTAMAMGPDTKLGDVERMIEGYDV